MLPTASLIAIFSFSFVGGMAAVLSIYAWDTVLSALSAVIGAGRRWMTDRLYRTLLLACGIFFTYLDRVFLSQGIAGLG